MERETYLDESGYLVTNKKGIATVPPKSCNDKPQPKQTKLPEFKLWICDILNATVNSKDGEIKEFDCHGFTVINVDILGVVSEVRSNSYGVLYKVDDGTGEIGCWHDNRCILKKADLKNKLAEIVPSLLSKNGENRRSSELLNETPLSNSSAATKVKDWLKKQILNHAETMNCPFELGDTVQLRGKLTDFREERCVRIFDIRLVKDINEETDRKFELVYLYKTLYSSK